MLLGSEQHNSASVYTSLSTLSPLLRNYSALKDHPSDTHAKYAQFEIEDRQGGIEEISYSSPSSTPACDHSFWFFGSRKDNPIEAILESQQHKKKIAVIVNDMAGLNIDSSLVEKSGLVHTKQEIVSMQNGCIVVIFVDVIREVSRLQKLDAFDYLLIESTGISEPMQVVW